MALAASGGNELLDLFTRYNEDWWPFHLVTYALGVAPVVLLLARDRRRADVASTYLLAVLWLWLGVVFQGMYATDVVLTVGIVYAALFLLQAVLLFVAGRRQDLEFRASNGTSGVVGWLALGYAIGVYPILGAVLGHGWPEAPLLGMAPCPTTIATFGMLLLARPPIPHRLLVVPLIWALLAPPAAMDRGVYEDLGLLIAGVVSCVLIVVRDRRMRSAAEHDASAHDSTQPQAVAGQR